MQLALVVEQICTGARGCPPPPLGLPGRGNVGAGSSGACRPCVVAADPNIDLPICVSPEGPEYRSIDHTDYSGRTAQKARIGCTDHVDYVDRFDADDRIWRSAAADGLIHWGDFPVGGFGSHHTVVGRPVHLDGRVLDDISSDLELEAVVPEFADCIDCRPLLGGVIR